MPYRAPGLGDPRLDWILGEIRLAQSTLDDRIAEAQALPDTEPSKVRRIMRLNQMKREVDSAFIRLDAQIGVWAGRDMRSFYREGHNVASAQLGGAGFDFTLPHREALDIISNDAYDDIATRLLQVRAGFDNSIGLQKIFEGLDANQISTLQGRGRSAVTQALLTGEDPRKIARLFAQDIWKDGISIIDAGGRQWNPESYTRMLVRTKSANAYNAGSMNKYAEEGVTRVRVFDGVLDDPECAEANGQIWSLRFAMTNVLQHPNCRRAFAPEQGDGPVNRDTAKKYLVAFDRVELAVGAIAALRAFRNTGEVNVSSTLARLLIETGEIIAGVNLPLIDVFIQGLVAGSFRNFDTWIESYIDPVLYATGIVRNVPPRAGLQAALRPEVVIDTIADAVKAANVEAYGVEFHPGVRGVLDRLDGLGQNVAGAVKSGIGTGGEQYLDWVVRNALGPDRLGEITAEVFKQVRAGNYTDLRSAWAESARFVDDAREIRSLYVQAALASREEAEDIYGRLNDVLTQLASLLHHNTDIENLPAALDFMVKYSNVNPIDVERLVSYWSAQGRRIDFNDYEVRKLADVFEAAVIAQTRALSRIEEIDGVVARRAQRQLLMAAPSGPDFPTEIHTLWDPIDMETGVAELRRRIALEASDGLIDTVDEKVLSSWQEFFFMLHLEGSDQLRSEFAPFITPRFTEAIEGFVDAAEIDTPDKLLAFWTSLFTGLEIDPATKQLLSFGEEVDVVLARQIGEVLEWFDSDSYFTLNRHLPLIDLHWEPQLLAKHVGDTPLEDRGKILSQFWKTTLVDIQVPTVSEGVVDPYRNLEKLLVRAYDGSSVGVIGDSGVNGQLLTVVDPDTGRTLVIKRFDADNHAGGNPERITSMVMTEWVARYLSEAEITPTRFISVTDDPDDIIAVIGYFEGSTWYDVSSGVIRDDSARKFSLLDRLTLERDSHIKNIMVNQHTQTTTVIDREVGFRLGTGRHGPQPDSSDFGMISTPNQRYFGTLEEAWINGDDIDFLRNDPPVSLFQLSDAEFNALSPERSRAIVVRHAQSGGGNQFIFQERGFLVDSDGNIMIPTGRLGVAHFPGNTDPTKWYPSHFLTESELEFVQRLLDFDQVLLDDAISELEDRYNELSDAAKDAFIAFWEAGDIDDAYEVAAQSVLNTMRDRVQRLVDGGVINVSGGVTKHVDSATGAELRYGTTVRFTNKETGEIVEGLVLNLFESNVADERVSVLVAENIGMGRTVSELASNPPITTRVDVDDWVWGAPVEDTPIGLSIRYQRAVDEFEGIRTFGDDVNIDFRQSPVIDQYGMHVGFRDTTVEIDTLSVDGIASVFLTDEAGLTVRVPMDEIRSHPRFRDLIIEELGKVPPQYRPKTIKVSLSKLNTENGNAAFGLFDPDTGDLHISLMPLFDSHQIERAEGFASSFNLKLVGEDIADDVFQTPNWLSGLDWSPIEDVLRHELGHAVETGQERAALSRLNLRAFDQLREAHPDLLIDDLEVLAETLLPDAFDASGFDTNLAALLAHRAGIVEDVVNTNLVFEAKEILEAGLESGELPPWARAAYAGILREEPEAHHELFAELWRRTAGGGQGKIDQVAESLGLDQKVGLLANQRREVARDRIIKFLTRDPDIEIPSDWDIGSAEFNRWLTDVLSPAASRIIPLERNLNRRLWSAQRYSVPDIRVRVLRTAPEDGGGGITVNLVTGNEPTTGFSVAKKANERVFRNVTEDAEFDEVVEQYIREFRGDLAKPQWELGIWLDDDGTLYIDTVKVFEDEIDAAVFGFREGQRAMFHLDTFDTINLIDDYADIDAYIAGRKIVMDYATHLARTKKIGGVTRVTGTGLEKVAEEFFEEGGRFTVMSISWMTPKDQERLLRAVTDRFTKSITLDQGKANLIEILERGLVLFGDQPSLQDEFTQFYRVWRAAFIDAAASTRGRPVEIPTDRIAAAAAGMSASLSADINLATVLNMVDVISRDMRMNSAMVRETKASILKSAHGPKGATTRLRKAIDKGDITLAKKEAAYIKELEALAETFRVGQKINLMDPRRRMRAIAGTMIAEERIPIHVARSWSFYEKSVAVLLGEMETYQALTDTKFRPFYNNIIDPGDIRNTREVTIDFVMMNAFFNAKGFDKINPGTPTVQGIQAGLRPVISDTLRVLMDEGWGDRFGITTDLEMQSLLWSLFRYGTRNDWWQLETVTLKK